MTEVLQLINAVIFFFLGGIHVYWVLGGSWGIKFAIPSTEEGRPVLKPRKVGTLVVAIGLVVAALLNLNVLVFGHGVYFVIGLLFGLRVIGDFKYVGLGKKVKNTIFAQKDATVFIPLCLYLSLSHLFLFFW